MYTVLERVEAQITKDRSIFIAILFHVTSTENVKQYLEAAREDFPKAKHYCYAYVIDDKEKCSDDGEPSKTAGRPLLELLKKKNLNETLIVVVRYFGGVLLGASRLMSTYIEAGVNVIDHADIVEIAERYIYHASLTYSEFDTLKRLIKREDFSLENLIYGDKIDVDILCSEDDASKLTEWFPNCPIEVIGKKRTYRR